MKLVDNVVSYLKTQSRTLFEIAGGKRRGKGMKGK